MKRNKRVLLTGASRGIGKAIYELLTQQYDVIAPTRSMLDLARPESIADFFGQDAAYDVVINCAGINIIKPTKDIVYEDIKLINAVNLESPLLIIQQCLPHMQGQQWGRVINISSIWGQISKAQRTLYSGSKFGLIGYTKALAKEFASQNILVNAICPGFTNTELTAQSLSQDELTEIVATIPANRLAEPNEIAKLVKFMISDDNSYMTGEAVTIDGGFLS
tara:strand:+ start:84 stop:746 length:663 start_codon:yes stop_codon:yes gene_type:complete